MHVRKLTCAVGCALAVVPATAIAAPSGEDRRNAARECRALRAAMGAENFASEFGRNANDRNAFGKCVSRKAREEAAERRRARSQAMSQCREERNDPNFPASHDGRTFEEFYGTGPRNRNAFGRCVSRNARANEREADRVDRERVNAARACRAEQRDPDFPASHDGKSFAEFYGTNANDRNAFGKCVSRKAREREASS